ATVAGGARLGAGTVRPDPNLSHGIDAGDRATTGANFHHLDDRNGNGHATALLEPIGTRNLEGLGGFWYLILNQANLGRSAPHVIGKHLVNAISAGHMGCE